MQIEASLANQDLAVNWHPCMQMKDFENFPPISIKFAQDEFLFDYQGNSYIDATSSWWCKSLGHNQPRLHQAMIKQMQKFEHVLYSNTTNETIVELSSKLIKLIPHCQRVSYASDGSSAVEIAVKMSMQANQILNNGRNQLAALSGGYHGETILTLALGDCSLYSKPFEHLLPKVKRITNIPLVSGKTDDEWFDSDVLLWQKTLIELEPLADKLSSIVIEPIVQGAGGVRIYSANFLQKISVWARENNIHLIVDEIMTGFLRTGKMFAFQHANIKPDFICLGKGLTAGVLPMSAVVTTEEIYQLFYDDYDSGKAFLHSHTHSGNALTAAVANEAIDMTVELSETSIVDELEKKLLNSMQEVVEMTGVFENLRCIGGIAAVDLIDNTNRKANLICFKARQHGALLRPLGKTIYWMPPLNSSKKSIDVIKNACIKSLR